MVGRGPFGCTQTFAQDGETQALLFSKKRLKVVCVCDGVSGAGDPGPRGTVCDVACVLGCRLC